MKILVTGAAGFIGKWTVSEIAQKGHEAFGLDKLAGGYSVQADITDVNQITETFKEIKPDAVIHLAAISGSSGKNEIEQSMRQSHLNFLVNSMGTANVCEAMKKCGIGKLVYMSTFAVYGKSGSDRLPLGPNTSLSLQHAYAYSKYMGELSVRAYSEDFGIKSAIIRAPFISGEGQNERNVLVEFVDCAIDGKDLILLGQGQHVREFVHPIDLANAFMRAVEKLDDFKEQSEVFVVGNRPISTKQLAEMVVSKVGTGQIVVLPDLMGRGFDQYSNWTKAKELLGWSPTIGIEEIVERVVRDRKSHRKC